MADTDGSNAREGEALFLSELATIERVIAFVAARHHLGGAEAEDFSSHVKLTLIQDDYAVLRKFEGRSSLRTYLTIVIQRLFLDYRISLWGKWRPSAEARRAGAVAILLEQLMSRDGHSFGEACELIVTNHRVAITTTELERLAVRLPPRLKRRFEGEDALADIPAEGAGADAAAARREHERMAGRVSAGLARVTSGLDPQDRLILAMRFDDGRTVAEIAATLRLEQKALYRRVERLLRHLRAGLEADGIQASAVIEMLESRAVTTEWKAESRVETTLAGPSMKKGAHEWR